MSARYQQSEKLERNVQKIGYNHPLVVDGITVDPSCRSEQDQSPWPANAHRCTLGVVDRGG